MAEKGSQNSKTPDFQSKNKTKEAPPAVVTREQDTSQLDNDRIVSKIYLLFLSTKSRYKCLFRATLWLDPWIWLPYIQSSSGCHYKAFLSIFPSKSYWQTTERALEGASDTVRTVVLPFSGLREFIWAHEHWMPSTPRNISGALDSHPLC